MILSHSVENYKGHSQGHSSIFCGLGVVVYVLEINDSSFVHVLVPRVKIIKKVFFSSIEVTFLSVPLFI